MVAVLGVLDIELPVVRQNLREAAQHYGLSAVEDPFDAAQDLFPQIILDIVRIFVEGAEYHATDRGDA